MEKGRTRNYRNAAQGAREEQLRLLLGDRGGQNVKNMTEIDGTQGFISFGSNEITSLVSSIPF